MILEQLIICGWVSTGDSDEASASEKPHFAHPVQQKHDFVPFVCCYHWMEVDWQQQCLQVFFDSVVYRKPAD